MSEEIKNKLPKRPKEHVIGDRAVNVFKFKAKKEWVANESKSDYGWDILVTIEESERVREDFFVQLKGHTTPNYIEDKKFISESINVSTIRWLLEKPMPSMLCVCDEGNTSEPIYYVWIKDAMEEIHKMNPSWGSQETINIKIPTSNNFDTSHEAVEDYVKKYYTEFKIRQLIGEVIAPSESLPPETLLAFREKPENFIYSNVAPKLIDAGLADIVNEEGAKKIKKLSEGDQALHKKLTEASTFLNAFNDTEAERVLSSIDSKINKAPDGIKARYFNNEGVLALHLGKSEEALSLFEKAYKLRSQEAKYITNYLLCQFQKYKSSQNKADLKEKFLDLLDAVIKENPEFWPAIRLKTYWLAEFESIEKAATFLKNSQALEKDPLASYACLAEIFKEKNKVNEAIEILEEVENKKLSPGIDFYSLMGFLQFQKAFGININAEETILYSAGSASLNIAILEKAKNYFSEAYKLLSIKGFPRIFEACIVNFATVLDLFGYYSDSETICKTYLERHPESVNVNGSLGASLAKQGKFRDAKKHTKTVFDSDKKSPAAFKNLIICFYFAEDYDDLLKVVSERDGHFINKDEEGLARLFATLSYAELGMIKEAKDQIALMEKDDALKIKSIIAKADMENKFGNKSKASDIYRSALKECPDNLELLHNLLILLTPLNKDNALEVAESLKIIKEHRQLIHEEYYQLGKAYLILNRPDESEEIFREAVGRYPGDHRFIYEHALALFTLGNEEGSYIELENYLKIGERNYTILKNIAIIARDTNRIDDAIKFFNFALNKASNETQRGEIHCQLYELKSKKEYPTKERLRHIIEFGRTTNEKPELEARYLLLFMFATASEIIEDLEVKEWIKDFQNRLEKFTKAYPNFPALRAFTFTGKTDEEKGRELLSTIAFLTLPQKLKTASIEIVTRSGEWPLVIRSRILYSYLSIFEYWATCTKSKEPEHSIHIWRPYNKLEEEEKNAGNARRICIDITALLTLAEFDLLNLLHRYDQIIISSGTRISLERERSSFKSSHPLAEKINNWRNTNRSKVRTRSLKDAEEDDHDLYELVNGIFVKKNKSIDETFGDGCGETLLLAQKLNLPLYSDEASIRNIANEEYKVLTFSTLGVIRGNLSLTEETRFLSQMISKNFKVVPFGVEHLDCRFRECLGKKPKGQYIKSDELITDEILGEFLKQFADYTYINILTKIAIDWWLVLIDDPNIPYEQLPECMSYISYTFSMKSIGTVLKGIVESEQERRAAALWATFLLKTYRKYPDLTVKAWPAIKTCCSRYFRGREERILFNFIPDFLKNILEGSIELKDEQKVTILYELPKYFSYIEKAKYETYFVKHKPKFIK